MNRTETVDASLEILVLCMSPSSPLVISSRCAGHTLRQLSYLIWSNLAETLPRCLHA